jgi:hypothetical protein
MGLYCIGAILIVGSALLVVFKREVSLGHAAVIAIGAILIAIPQLTDVEVSSGGVKFTTRAQGEALTSKVKGTNEQIQALQDGLEKITKALAENVQRIAAIEAKAEPGLSKDKGAGSWGTYNKPFFDDLMKQNDAAKTATTERLRDLDQLKKTFQPEAGYAPLK